MVEQTQKNYKQKMKIKENKQLQQENNMKLF